ncbi:MAG: hypothetical protein ABI140_14785 [Jatrophihabitantaceae bacterium]
MAAVRRAAAESIPLDKVMSAILGVLVAEREDRLASLDGKNGIEPKKTELILANSGLSVHQIGELLDKKPDTVQKTITRARAKSTTGAES